MVLLGDDQIMYQLHFIYNGALMNLLNYIYIFKFWIIFIDNDKDRIIEFGHCWSEPCFGAANETMTDWVSGFYYIFLIVHLVIIFNKVAKSMWMDAAW